MTNYADRYDTLRKDAWHTLHDANHLAKAYRLRAIELTKWQRIRDFINLGVAPALLLLTFTWEDVLLRNILFCISGICSVSSWMWTIFGSAFNWNNQLHLSIEIPQKLSFIIPDIDENLKILHDANTEEEARLAANKLKVLTRRVKELRGEIEREQVHVKSWMNLIAQQDTMQKYEATCLGCYQKWIPGSRILDQGRAIDLLKDSRRHKLKDICEQCGQKLNKTN